MYKQIEAIVYYPKKTRWSTLNIVYGESVLHNDKRVETHSQWWRVVVIYRVTVTVTIHCSSRKLCKSMYQVLSDKNPFTCMGKNNNGLVYRRLINATVLYLLTTVLYFLYSTLDILWHIKYCFCL